MTIEHYQPSPARPIVPFSEVDAPLPDAMTPLDVIAKQRGIGRELRAEAKRVQLLPLALEEHLAQARATLEAARGETIVPNVSADGSCDFRNLFAPFTGGTGHQVYAPDPVQLFLSDPANFDRMIAAAEAKIKERHKGLTETLSTADKKRRAREIAADILAAERIECAAIWAARASGHEVAFRADVDCRAVLGIEGPPPRKRG